MRNLKDKIWMGDRWVTPAKFAERKAAMAQCQSRPEYRERCKALRNTPKKRALRNSYAKRWRKSASQRKKLRDYARKRRRENVIACVADRLRARIGEIFREKRIPKSGTTREILGCDFATLVQFIEGQFVPGMGWHNRHLWHIDHRIPLSSASTVEELNRLCHYKNLQPLWAPDNQSKGGHLNRVSNKERVL